MNCTTCGSEMMPLFTSEFCPNDCDKPKSAVNLVLTGDNVEEDDWVERLFDDIWDDDKTADYCAACGSSDIEPFFVSGLNVTKHCNSCGKVW